MADEEPDHTDFDDDPDISHEGEGGDFDESGDGEDEGSEFDDDPDDSFSSSFSECGETEGELLSLALDINSGIDLTRHPSPTRRPCSTRKESYSFENETVFSLKKLTFHESLCQFQYRLEYF